MYGRTFLSLNQCVSTCRQLLHLILHVSVHFLCPVVGRCIHVFMHGASIWFDSGLATWLNLDTCGTLEFNLWLIEWFLELPQSVFIITDLAWTLCALY